MDKKDKNRSGQRGQSKKTEHASGKADEQEIAIDRLDDMNAEEVSAEKSDNSEKQKDRKSTPANTLLQTLCEDELQELLDARGKLEDQSKVLEEKSKLLAEYEDLLKRKQAEFENYRKRVKREFEDFGPCARYSEHYR